MSFLFVVREGFSGMGRAKLPAAITVMITFFALLLLSLFSTVSLSFLDVIEELRSRVEVEVFLGDSMSEAQAKDAVRQIKMVRGVSEALYVSKDEAAATFTQDFGEDIVRILGSNPLPRSVRLKFLPEYAHPESIKRIVPEIHARVPDVDIRYNQSFLGQIEENARLFNLVTGGLGVLISVATLVLTGYTIRLAMYSRQEKIRTMRLVGATGWFIGAPYLVEGALQGLISGVLAAGVLWLLSDQLLFRYEPLLYTAVQPSTFLVIPATVVLGLLLGLFGSALSVGNYLRAISKR